MGCSKYSLEEEVPDSGLNPNPSQTKRKPKGPSRNAYTPTVPRRSPNPCCYSATTGRMDVPDRFNDSGESCKDGGRCCVSFDGLCAEIRAVSYLSLDTTPPWAPPYPRGRAYLSNHGSD